MNKHNDVLILLQELQQLTTTGRISNYGIFNTLKLYISRNLNEDIVLFLNNYLEKLDDSIIKFNETPYKIFVNRILLGEIYNLTRLNISVSSDADTFFRTLFTTLNSLTLEVIKAGIDEIYDDDPNLLSVGSTIKSIMNNKSKTELSKIIKDLLVSYYSLVMNDNLKKLDSIRNNTTFMRDILSQLESQTNQYIKSKYTNIQKNI